MFCSRVYHGGGIVRDPEIITVSIYRTDYKKLRAIAIANDLRDLKNHPSMREAVRFVLQEIAESPNGERGDQP